jgi:hypothetical protein
MPYVSLLSGGLPRSLRPTTTIDPHPPKSPTGGSATSSRNGEEKVVPGTCRRLVLARLGRTGSKARGWGVAGISLPLRIAESTLTGNEPPPNDRPPCTQLYLSCLLSSSSQSSSITCILDPVGDDVPIRRIDLDIFASDPWLSGRSKLGVGHLHAALGTVFYLVLAREWN